jgi:hypothetical protein
LQNDIFRSIALRAMRFTCCAHSRKSRKPALQHRKPEQAQLLSVISTATTLLDGEQGCHNGLHKQAGGGAEQRRLMAIQLLCDSVAHWHPIFDWTFITRSSGHKHRRITKLLSSKRDNAPAHRADLWMAWDTPEAGARDNSCLHAKGGVFKGPAS